MNHLLNTIVDALEAELAKKDIAYYFIGMPYAIGDDVLNRGLIILKPISTTASAVTTGIQDQDNFTVKLILGKQMKSDFNRNAQKESGDQFGMRMMEGRSSDRSLLANTIRSIVRKNLRQWGVNQPTINIDYDTDELKMNGAYTATMTITVEDFTDQTIN